MKNPTMGGLILVSMENMVRNTNGSSICVETKSRTKWILLGELGTHIHWSSIIGSLIDCLVALCILKTSMDRDLDWSRNVREESLVDNGPVNSRIVDTGGGGPLDRTKDGGGIGPDREEIRTDPLLHLHHPLLLGLLGVVDVGRGQGLYGIKELGDLLGVGDELGDFLGVRDELGDLLGVGEGLLGLLDVDLGGWDGGLEQVINGINSGQ